MVRVHENEQFFAGDRVMMLRAAIVAFVLSLLTLALSLTTAVSMLTN